AGAFNRTGAAGWLWFMKRAGKPPLDENAARAEFLSWLKAANQEEIGRFIEAANRYRPALLQTVKAFGELVLRERIASGEGVPENERGTILMGAEGRALWRAAEREAGGLAQKSM